MKPHRTDAVSLIFGLLFLTFVLAYSMRDRYAGHPAALGWVLAAGLLVAGVLGLAAGRRSARDQRPARQGPAVTEPEPVDPVDDPVD